MADTTAIRTLFPALQGECAVTSSDSENYSCIAWAAGDVTRWWWPIDGYWPQGVERRRTVECFVAAFRTLGYEPCEDDAVELGYEKVAIYADRLDRPTHMARQLGSGWWTSKLGECADVTHRLAGLEGPGLVNYGRTVKVLRRRRIES